MAVSINDVPDKLFLSDYGGNYSTYIDAVYSVFRKLAFANESAP